MDLLSEIAEALTAAGLEPEPVRRVLAQVRHTWGGETIYIRKHDATRRASEVRALVALGLSFRATARELGCSDGTVRRLIARG